MAVELRELTKDNWIDCIDLEVAEDQTRFVAPNLYSIAEGSFTPGTEKRAIYAGDTMVGFVMWKVDSINSFAGHWIWRFMIDRKHQRQGYGRAAMEQVIDLIKADPDADDIYVSFVTGNLGAERLYHSVGFENTGVIVYKAEMVAHLKLDR
jgi:diamine N-acetyltransferase